MKALSDIKKAAHDGLEYLLAQPDVVRGEVFVSSTEQLIDRVDFKSDIPSAGVEEPKSVNSYGISVSVELANGDPLATKSGFGAETSDISIEGVKLALQIAREGAVADPDYPGLPKPDLDVPLMPDIHDKRVMDISESEFVGLGWQALRGALDIYQSQGLNKSIVVGGDVMIRKERMAVCNSEGVDASDEATTLRSMITSMIENEQVKGGGSDSGTFLDAFSPYQAGASSARSAIATRGGERVDSGKYHVVFGRQAMADIVDNLILRSLSLESVDSSSSMFSGKLGEVVASDLLSIYDDATIPNEVGSKRMTCEGLPTGRTDLIEKGRVVGFLANHYYANKCANKFRTFKPCSGFRSSNGGRDFSSQPRTSPTNVVVLGRDEKSLDEIFRLVGDGLYIGRIWYTYPVNGPVAGDFTCTVIGDSYVIKDGRLAGAIRPNTLRINDNVKNIMRNISAIGNERQSTLLWAGGASTVMTPLVSCREVNVQSIAGFMG